MAVSKYQLKKWANRYLLKRKTALQQGVGKVYSVTEIKGYYNDLTEKVINGESLLPDEIPRYYKDTGEKFVFSIGVMQYGLACYDLYLLNGEDKHLDKMFVCADWAVENQMKNGGWKTFEHLYPENPYSSMAQGEGISLLVRAYKESSNEKYMQAAQKAVSFLLTPVEDGGVAIITETELIFKEYTQRPIVMNGWIFSLWGLLDYIKLTEDKKIKEQYEKSLATLEKYISHYDLGYWTRYDYSERIAAPFYHKLHIDQFTVMYDLTGDKIFLNYKLKFEKYRDNFFYRNKAFVVKAKQKLMGK